MAGMLTLPRLDRGAMPGRYDGCRMSGGEWVLTRRAVQELDRRAAEAYGIPSIVLMENAGRACAEAVLELLAVRAERPVLVLCGPGNNGGDGLVVARTLSNRGVPVHVAYVGDPARLEHASSDVRTNLRLWRGLGREVEPVRDAADASALRDGLPTAPVVVDALFGIGLTRPLREPWLSTIRAINESGRPVVAVDLPSGLDADSGEALGAIVQAATTVTFVALKPGLARGQGPAHAGRVRVAEIGIPREWIAAAAR